jgi:ribosomal protein L12E/L44/L45/RPP1/RPP2
LFGECLEIIRVRAAEVPVDSSRSWKKREGRSRQKEESRNRQEEEEEEEEEEE